MNIHSTDLFTERKTDLFERAALNPRERIGGNFPPSDERIESPPTVPVAPTLVAIDHAREAYPILSLFLKEVPVVEFEDDAKRGANLIEQGRRTLGSMEDERDRRVRPLNQTVKEINEEYRVPRESTTRILDEIKGRLKQYSDAEEARRLQAAAAAQLAAEEAERQARAAEDLERNAKAEAAEGVLDVNVAAAIVNADKSFATFQKAARTAVRAERQIPVRLSGGFGRTVSMRKTETLEVKNFLAAFEEIGLTEALAEALLTGARAFRKLHGRLPAGIEAITDRKF